MNSILLIIFYSILAVSSTKPNFCINCKHFKTSFLTGDDFGTCKMFPTVIRNHDFLVNGKEDKVIGYEYCSIVRKYNDKCGTEGKLYEEKTNIWDFLKSKIITNTKNK
jgi:hypothetical protein